MEAIILKNTSNLWKWQIQVKRICYADFFLSIEELKTRGVKKIIQILTIVLDVKLETKHGESGVLLFFFSFSP